MATEKTYVLDGPTEFFFPYPVRTSGELVVSLIPGGVLPPADYTVIGASATANGVTVRYPNAPRDGSIELNISRQTEPDRVSTFLDDLSITATGLNAEFDNILQIVQDGVVNEFKGDWATGELYLVLDVVKGPDGNIYVSQEQHESNVFADDLAAGKWELAADFASGQQSIDAAVIDAQAARDKAEQWAEEPEDSQVETGKYSALHHAAKAADSATAASNSASAASTSEQNAATSEQNASDSAIDAGAFEDKAQKWAQETEDVEVEPGLFSAFHWAQKAQEFAEGAASNISYDNTTSGLTATDVQAALDEVSDAENIAYDNTTSGLSASNVKAAVDEVSANKPEGLFSKSDRDSVAWTKTGNGTAETGQTLFVEVDGSVLEIASGTSITMPTLSVGTDYAIWVAPDGSLEADTSFSSAPTAGGRLVGGFHYAPGGRATLDLNQGDGGTTSQIMETSFWDLKWRPSAIDPRGLVLVGDGSFWAGMYHMSSNHLTGPVHKYGVDPCRDGNPPQNINGTGDYPNAEPSNIIEALEYHGFRAPNYWEFQLLAFGVSEQRNIGGSGPGNTGDVSDRGKDQQTSAWGVFDATGVLWHWGNDTILTTSDQTLPNPSRGNRFRYSRFASFGGSWGNSYSGSRCVFASTAAVSTTDIGGRGVCDHLILD